MSVEQPRKTLHSKRSFGKYPRNVDSPAYDASEEDNDPLTDDGASAVSIPIRARTKPTPPARPKHQLAASLLSDSDGVDSPTYDGDIESSATAGPDGHTKPSHHHHYHHTFSSVSTLSMHDNTTPNADDKPTPIAAGTAPRHPPAFLVAQTLDEPAVSAPAQAAFNPAALTPEDIQAFVQKAVDGETTRSYKINRPPTNRPVRIYADGVYDLFHFGHALQLRQAKLAFPSVYLLVGVCSDELVKTNKARTIQTHPERLEAARHCRWVDEVVAEAPWIIDEAFVQKYQIDYVAHDEDPYAAAGHDDVYSYVKQQGKFIPTRRTPGISTSALLERIVLGYRARDFDEKLTKMGHAELRAEGSDWDDQSPQGSSRFASRSISPNLESKPSSTNGHHDVNTAVAP
ncbi:hypothetical protein BDN72DRAFT_764786 [Pluteus cervinus]|uniref:Uncharacterized protein n=1 Tax=Pluteus cervinus TaxID=181527 RepID=A0ACD3B3M9_9AGAR|nr:hypothetical protein BDN72DRAFT_764786 [Pluteus cervinus]